MTEIEALIKKGYLKENKVNNPWDDSPYKDFRKMSIDARGKIERKLFH